MDYLPLEVLNKIAKNRTLYVLAASLTVSVGWRGSCNKNWMWWQHYNADTAEYLEAAECRAGEVASTRTGCGGNTVTRTMLKTGMDYLPLEVLNKIAKNRTLYVLAASLTVSVGWRGSCNKNWMWWQHYNADTAEYLEAAECRVEPRFESQESEDSTLTCLYKRAGDKEISIKESL
ncbi:hypothetical protein J6590_083217 [Homalodisca vitripennis]|nr:hypothetical protein J6590_083217 [Homalodisca vitripennis]